MEMLREEEAAVEAGESWARLSARLQTDPRFQVKHVCKAALDALWVSAAAASKACAGEKCPPAEQSAASTCLSHAKHACWVLELQCLGCAGRSTRKLPQALYSTSMLQHTAK